MLCSGECHLCWSREFFEQRGVTFLLELRAGVIVLKLTVLELPVRVGTVGELELLAFELLVFEL